MHVPPHPQVIKNLLFVGKVIYLISPESDIGSPQEEVKENEEEEEEEEQRETGHEEDVTGEEVEEKEEGDDDQDDRPPSLLWLIKKLSLMAKREAANTPKVPLKVHIFMFPLSLSVQFWGPHGPLLLHPVSQLSSTVFIVKHQTASTVNMQLVNTVEHVAAYRTVTSLRMW